MPTPRCLAEIPSPSFELIGVGLKQYPAEVAGHCSQFLFSLIQASHHLPDAAPDGYPYSYGYGYPATYSYWAGYPSWGYRTAYWGAYPYSGYRTADSGGYSSYGYRSVAWRSPGYYGVRKAYWRGYAIRRAYYGVGVRRAYYRAGVRTASYRFGIHPAYYRSGARFATGRPYRAEVRNVYRSQRASYSVAGRQIVGAHSATYHGGPRIMARGAEGRGHFEARAQHTGPNFGRQHR